MEPHERAVSVWYRTAGLISRDQKDLAVEIIEAEIRSAQHEVLLDAARLVLSGDPVEIARQLRDRAERTIRPQQTGPRPAVSWTTGLTRVSHFPFGPRDGVTLIVRRQRSSSTVQSFCFTFNQRVVRPRAYWLASSLAISPLAALYELAWSVRSAGRRNVWKP